jgi:hypothetical protein
MKIKIPFLQKKNNNPKPKKPKKQPVLPKDERRSRQGDYLRRINERRKALR